MSLPQVPTMISMEIHAAYVVLCGSEICMTFYKVKITFLFTLFFGYGVGKSLAVLPNGSLQISRAVREDAGTYMCVAQNPAGTALGKIKLNVQGT